MRVILSSTLMDSLGRLSAGEQAAAKQSVFDFQVNPGNPGLQFHRIEASKDRNFWSARVNQDLRMVVHRSGDASVLCYIGHHDDAYRWAEKRKLDARPDGSAARFIVFDERVERVVKRVIVKERQEPQPFATLDHEALAALGVPPELEPTVRAAGTSHLDGLIGIVPDEAMERLLEIAAGRPLPLPEPVAPPQEDPYLHPDARRRFMVVDSAGELRKALESGSAGWAVFLHPDQRAIVERRWKGPALVTGAAGTGKTVVALHRAVRLLGSEPTSRVLLTTYSTTLAARLEHNAGLLLGTSRSEHGRLTVANLHRLARDIWTEIRGRAPRIVDDRTMSAIANEAADRCRADGVTSSLLRAEWGSVVDPQGLRTAGAYRTCSRAGRATPLGQAERDALWPGLAMITARLEELGLLSWGQLFSGAAELVAGNPARRFDFVVADEVQDFGLPELRFLKGLTTPGAEDLFLCGDAGQTIYKGRSLLSRAGIDVRGRSTRLKINYRTTRQIQSFAERLVDARAEDEGEGRFTISLLSGEEPVAKAHATVEEEIATLRDWLKGLRASGMKADEIAIFARTDALAGRARDAVEQAGLTWYGLDDDGAPGSGSVAIGTMHRAKGLEFRAVAVVGCSDGAMPLAAAVEGAEDPGEQQAVKLRERRLFYVACSRARERLMLTWTGRPSPYLPDPDHGGSLG